MEDSLERLKTLKNKKKISRKKTGGFLNKVVDTKCNFHGSSWRPDSKIGLEVAESCISRKKCFSQMIFLYLFMVQVVLPLDFGFQVRNCWSVCLSANLLEMLRLLCLLLRFCCSLLASC